MDFTENAMILLLYTCGVLLVLAIGAAICGYFEQKALEKERREWNGTLQRVLDNNKKRPW